MLDDSFISGFNEIVEDLFPFIIQCPGNAIMVNKSAQLWGFKKILEGVSFFSFNAKRWFLFLFFFVFAAGLKLPS